MSDFLKSLEEYNHKGLLPRHIAVIMDGNGRWAQHQGKERNAGHLKGADAARSVVEGCYRLKIPFVTLFAFSTENWLRPQEEVSFLHYTMVIMLRRELRNLHNNGVCIKIAGDKNAFSDRARRVFAWAERVTKDNKGLTLTLCINYGGRWDIMQAVNRAKVAKPLDYALTEDDINQHLALHFAPEPDLLIRTSGELRLSNFLLWQLAYTELYFTDTLWPDFSLADLEKAILSYVSRQRRFGDVT